MGPKEGLLMAPLLLSSIFVIDGGSIVEASIFQRHKAHVQITNNLGGGQDLTIHCKSKDDDLGQHLLTPGATFDIHFRPNIGCSTLFWCSFAWPNAFHYFDIYDCGRDHPRCSNCPWKIWTTGPCLYLSDETFLCDVWNK